MPTLFRQTKPHALPARAEIVDEDGEPHARIRDGKQTELFPLTADGARYLRPTPMWCAMVRGADGKRKPVRLRSDKDAATVLLARLPKEIEEQKAGLLTPATAHQGRPLSALLAEYRTYRADQWNASEQTTPTVRRCELTFVGCGFPMLGDLDAEVVGRWLASRRRESARFGAQTSNHYVASWKAFGNWLVASRRSSENPFRPLAKQNVAVDVRHERRPLTADEFDRLLMAASAGKRFRKLAGSDRMTLCTVAAYTGLRASELASLTAASVSLASDPPALTVEAGYSKRKRKDTVPLHPGVAGKLGPWLVGEGRAAVLWPGKWASPFTAAAMLERDSIAVRAAWIAEATDVEDRATREQSDFLAYEDASGGKADFHALRHKFITELVEAGVQPKDAEELARHSTIASTMDRYAHVTRKDTAEALSRLSGPSVGRGKGVAPGVAGRGDGREKPGRDEELITRARTGSHGRHDTKKTLREQGFDGKRGSAKTSEQAEGEGFEPTAGTGPTPVFKTGALNRSATPPVRSR